MYMLSCFKLSTYGIQHVFYIGRLSSDTLPSNFPSLLTKPHMYMQSILFVERKQKSQSAINAFLICGQNQERENTIRLKITLLGHNFVFGNVAFCFV